VRPIFVVGSPRSGTTLIGNYIGSSSTVLNLGEYAAFYYMHALIPPPFSRFPSPYNQRYLEALKQHAADFARDAALDQGCSAYCDATPWNLLIGRELAQAFPNALFVLVLRHFSGVILSLERSYTDGFTWAGDSWESRARVWSSFYNRAAFLPRDRMITVGYDQLCATPDVTVERLRENLAQHGVDATGLDLGTFAVSHATNPAYQRPTLATSPPGNGGGLRRISSVDLTGWTTELNRAVAPLVGPTNEMLGLLFPADYTEPDGFAALVGALQGG
jgi:hypothetical protein